MKGREAERWCSCRCWSGGWWWWWWLGISSCAEACAGLGSMCLEFCTSFEDKTVSPCTCFGGLRSASKDIYPFMIDRNVLRSGFTSPRPGVKFSSARGFCMKTCLSVDPEATSRWTSLFSSVRCDVIYPPPPLPHAFHGTNKTIRVCGGV